jgi:exopolyphosphatase / guanosine-5'-triphosphate,3'-diphosphate pyrophosphatase
MILSVIDIGTNTVLMVTVETRDGAIVRVIGDEHAIARLGKGVDALRMILPETFDRLEGYLRSYRAIAEAHGAERIVAFGTSALRDARNRTELIDAMRDRVGIEIEILSGDDEALWTYRGALFGLRLGRVDTAVLDIGGGSTELAVGDGESVRTALSLDIGAVRITERYFQTLPPTRDQLAAAREWASASVSEFFPLPLGTRLVGVAGTVTTLGAIARGLERFDAEELNGTTISRESIDATIDRLSRLTLEQTAAIPQIASGRADIILGGTVILSATLRHLGTDEITVSTRGVRYGVAMREAAGE